MLVNDTENKQIQAATEKIEKEVAKVEEAKETGADSAKATDMTLDDIFADLGPNYGIAEPVANNDGFINKENATNYLNKTLGLSEDDVIFVPTIIEITSAGFYVLGRASLDSITLLGEYNKIKMSACTCGLKFTREGGRHSSWCDIKNDE